MHRSRGSTSILIALLVSGCSRPYGGFSLDPSAANVVPASGPDAAVISTDAPPDSLLPGVEGGVLFVRLKDPGGRIILDRPFAWPADHQNVPPAAYHLTVYWRGCNGNCSNLGDEAPPFCVADVVAAPRGQIRIHITASDLATGSTCTVTTR